MRSGSEPSPDYVIDATGPVYAAARSAFREASGVDVVDMGMGGSIPFIALFAEAFPEATILVTGVEDPGTQHQRESALGCAWTRRGDRVATAGHAWASV